MRVNELCQRQYPVFAFDPGEGLDTSMRATAAATVLPARGPSVGPSEPLPTLAASAP